MRFATQIAQFIAAFDLMYAVMISASTSLFGAPMHLSTYHGRALWLACWKVYDSCIQTAEVSAEAFTHKETINTSTVFR